MKVFWTVLVLVSLVGKFVAAVMAGITVPEWDTAAHWTTLGLLCHLLGKEGYEEVEKRGGW